MPTRTSVILASNRYATANRARTEGHTDGGTNIQILLRETEKLLNEWKHPDPYRAPTAPGGAYRLFDIGLSRVQLTVIIGNKWERNIPAPILPCTLIDRPFSMHDCRLTIYCRCGAPRCPLMDWILSMDVIILGVCESISHTICRFSSYSHGHM